MLLRKKKNSLISIFAFGLCLGATSAAHGAEVQRRLNWPVSDKIKNGISSTFGESRNDHFHGGIDIPGENLPVLPVYKGVAIRWTATA